MTGQLSFGSLTSLSLCHRLRGLGDGGEPQGGEDGTLGVVGWWVQGLVSYLCGI